MRSQETWLGPLRAYGFGSQSDLNLTHNTVLRLKEGPQIRFFRDTNSKPHLAVALCKQVTLNKVPTSSSRVGRGLDFSFTGFSSFPSLPVAPVSCDAHEINDQNRGADFPVSRGQ